MTTLRDIGNFDAGQMIGFAEAGKKQRTLAELGQRAAQGDYAGAEAAAWQGGAPEWATQLNAMGREKHEQLIQDAAQFAISATTPELWAAGAEEFKRLHPEFVVPPFQARQALIDRAVPVVQQLQMQREQANADRNYALAVRQENRAAAAAARPDYVSVEPGETLFDPATGKSFTPSGPDGKPLREAPNPASIANITTMRKEYESQPGTSRYRTAVPILASMAASVDNPSAMADLDFIYGMAKIYDPESVVRESEMGMVIEGQSLPAMLVGLFDKVANGQAVLQPQVRRDLVEASQTRVGEYRTQAEQEADSFRGIAERNTINPMDIIRPLENMPVLAPANLVPPSSYGQGRTVPPSIGSNGGNSGRASPPQPGQTQQRYRWSPERGIE